MRFFITFVLLSWSLLANFALADTQNKVASNLPTLQPDSKSVAEKSADKDAVCTRCHDETESKPVLSIALTAHGNKADPRAPSCQSCHGDSEKHVKGAGNGAARPAPDVMFNKFNAVTLNATSDVKEQNATCLSCHDKDPKRRHWQGGAHQVNDLSCTSCHETHTSHDKVRDKVTQPEVCFTCHKEQRAQTHKFSHHPIVEGKVACAECHNPHGSQSAKLMNKNTVNETCYTCHAEKRGPFLWEHQPVTEDCSTCHTPHGSNITPLLKSRSPFLCQECHDGAHNSKVPAAGNAAGAQAGLTALPSENYAGRACTNCHNMVHGSNHPAGALLQR